MRLRLEEYLGKLVLFIVGTVPFVLFPKKIFRNEEHYLTFEFIQSEL